MNMQDQNPAIWWLNPMAVFGAAGVLIGVAAFAIPEPLFRTYWRMPKFFDTDGLLVTLACVAVFGFGAVLATRLFTRAAASLRQLPAVPDIPDGFLTLLFNISVALCILGYVIWLGLAIQRGITLSIVTDIAKGEKGAMYDARFTYLPTVGGVTTLTQFGTAAGILGVLLGCRIGWKRVAPKLLIMFALAGARALLNSERFALVELAVPMLVIFLRLRYLSARRIPGPVRVLIAAAPPLGMAALFFLFTGFEYFRSWSNYYSGRDLNLWQFGGIRLLGYYVTSFNNGAFLIRELGPLHAPYFTLRGLWRFPLTAPIFDRLYPDPMFATADQWFYFPFLEAAGNLEFNNADGMLFPLMDFGIAGGLIYWLMAGLACGILYYLYLLSSPAGLLLYPIVFLTLLEAPLALYWSEGRALPSICLLILAVPLISYGRRRRQFDENLAKAEREILGVS